MLCLCYKFPASADPESCEGKVYCDLLLFTKTLHFCHWWSIYTYLKIIMKFQTLLTSFFAAAVMASPIGKREVTEGAAQWPSLPTIEERAPEVVEGAAQWPSLPTIEERALEETDGVAQWPSLPTIEE